MRPFVVYMIAFCLTALSAASEPVTTPAQRRIAAAEKLVERRADDPRSHAALALALSKRARETADPAYYAQAMASVERSLELAPGNFAARRARAWILLGQHEFAQALEEATALNRQAPDDLMVYGFLVDANVEVGRYEAAEEAAQWMLDLRPGNVAGLTRAAYLRELFGDLDGALELMIDAYGRVSPSEIEERAWLLTQIAHLQLGLGEPAAAATTLDRALQQFPGYHYALAGLARVKTAQGKTDEAAELYRARYEAAPHPECLYDLAAALERAGREDEAGTAFAEFERQALAESPNWDNANPELIRYYLERADQPRAALRVARMEFARRQDVKTLHSMARALHASGRGEEAYAQIDTALAVGIRNPEMEYLAGVIAASLGESEVAMEHLALAVESPFDEIEAAATKALVEVASSMEPTEDNGAWRSAAQR